MFNKILFPLDRSREAQEAIAVAIDLVQKYQSKLILLSVVEAPDLAAEVSDDPMMQSPEAIDRLLHSAQAMFAKRGIQSEILQREGKPAFTICDVADELNVNHLELRHEKPIEHTAINGSMASKVHMRLALPTSSELLWKNFNSKLRNQIRKGDKYGFQITWGGEESLDPFYAVLSENMRDLGTPVYGRSLFESILRNFPKDAELAVVWAGEKPISCALLLHGRRCTEVPTASSLRDYNDTCANMLMYRHLLDRAVERGQTLFDFGRSTIDGATFKFKKQWGAEPTPATWQYAVRRGEIGAMRPDNPRYERMIRLWQKLPVRLTQYIGPLIVRGIP